MQKLMDLLPKAAAVKRDFLKPSPDAVQRWHEHGAKKGDAAITAQLEAAGIRYFISENRHFLTQIADLPFEVMDAATVLGRLR